MVSSPTLRTKTITVPSSTALTQSTTSPQPIASVCTTNTDVSASVVCPPEPQPSTAWDDSTSTVPVPVLSAQNSSFATPYPATSVSASIMLQSLPTTYQTPSVAPSSATSGMPDVSTLRPSGSTTPPPTENDSGSHSLSSKASVALAVCLGVGILAAIFALFCLRRRQRRRRGASLANHVVPNSIGNDSAASTRTDDHLRAFAREEFETIAEGRPPSTATPTPLDRPISTIHICGTVLLSPSTEAPQTPPYASHEQTRPLSAPSGLSSHQADMAPSAQRESSSWYDSMASTRAAVGGSAGSPPRTRPDVDQGDIEKTSARRDSHGLGESRDVDPRPLPPGLPAPSALVPSHSSPLASARRTSALRTPRFVTVLMEVEEKELEDRGEPPPYERRLEPEEARGSREGAEAH
ncbi:hypothetical protein VTO73DRAFT_8979 [Trametes versicolor]